MTIQNKTIRIDIDAQSIRNLEDVIADLNEITRELGGTIEGVTRELGDLTSPSVTSTSKSAFSSVGVAMKLLKADSEKLSANLGSLTKNVFPSLARELKKIKDDLARILARWLQFWMLKYSPYARIGRFV